VTDDQVLDVRPGDVLVHHVNGFRHRYKVAEVRRTGLCINERSGAFEHAYAIVSFYFYEESDTARLSTGVESDEYIRGQGDPTHDATGRFRGWEAEPRAKARRVTRPAEAARKGVAL
jgi:hypothetical protein